MLAVANSGGATTRRRRPANALAPRCEGTSAVQRRASVAVGGRTGGRVRPGSRGDREATGRRVPAQGPAWPRTSAQPTCRRRPGHSRVGWPPWGGVSPAPRPGKQPAVSQPLMPPLCLQTPRLRPRRRRGPPVGSGAAAARRSGSRGRRRGTPGSQRRPGIEGRWTASPRRPRRRAWTRTAPGCCVAESPACLQGGRGGPVDQAWASVLPRWTRSSQTRAASSNVRCLALLLFHVA